MEYVEQAGGVALAGRDFSVGDTLGCGQFFRYAPLGQGAYTLVAFGRALRVAQRGDEIYLHPCAAEEFTARWHDFFDLGEDYGAIKAGLAAGGGVLAEAIAYGPGLRILRQDPWECLVTFILSQNNNIPRVKGIVERMAGRYGTCRGGVHAFPTPEALAAAGTEGLRQCGAGFRAKYISAAAQAVCQGFLHTLAQEPTRAVLETLPGVGPKVADCVLLYAFGQKQVFPVDVWVRRVMREYYFDGGAATPQAVWAFARETFGAYAGCAQQYLFHYLRNRGKR
jgi:N-glycosylase/DNA lyase